VLVAQMFCKLRPYPASLDIGRHCTPRPAPSPLRRSPSTLRKGRLVAVRAGSRRAKDSWLKHPAGQRKARRSGLLKLIAGPDSSLGATPRSSSDTAWRAYPPNAQGLDRLVAGPVALITSSASSSAWPLLNRCVPHGSRGLMRDET
jgi:hypothetical protein